jgi:hypothetical protein
LFTHTIVTAALLALPATKGGDCRHALLHCGGVDVVRTDV